jgi:hypothetical protein
VVAHAQVFTAWVGGIVRGGGGRDGAPHLVDEAASTPLVLVVDGARSLDRHGLSAIARRQSDDRAAFALASKRRR